MIAGHSRARRLISILTCCAFRASPLRLLQTSAAIAEKAASGYDVLIKWYGHALRQLRYKAPDLYAYMDGWRISISPLHGRRNPLRPSEAMTPQVRARTITAYGLLNSYLL